MKSPVSMPFDTSVFSGVWVLANFLVVNVHVFLLPTVVLDNPKNVFDLRYAKEPFVAILFLPLFILSNYAVDSFLFLSGYLFARTFCRKHRSQNYTLLHAVNHIYNRFIRLFPVFAIALAVGMWKGSRTSTKATEMFEIFYLLNCHPGFRKVSFSTLGVLNVTWSLSAGMQSHVFILLLLILVKNHSRADHFLFLPCLYKYSCAQDFYCSLITPWFPSRLWWISRQPKKSPRKLQNSLAFQWAT